MNLQRVTLAIIRIPFWATAVTERDSAKAATSRQGNSFLIFKGK